MINDPSHFLQLTAHVVIAIAAELLMQGLFNITYNHGILQKFSIAVDGVCAWLYSLSFSGGFVIKTAVADLCPTKQFAGTHGFTHIQFDQGYRLGKGAFVFFKSSVLNSSSNAWLAMIFLSLAFSSSNAFTCGSIL